MRWNKCRKIHKILIYVLLFGVMYIFYIVIYVRIGGDIWFMKT